VDAVPVVEQRRAIGFPGLDGARTLAVFAVILSHQALWSLGWVGVQLFFVLSGFLITGILQRASGSPLRVYLRNFYGRRVLRIFPLYYAYLAAIAVAVLLGKMPGGVAERLSYAAVYLSNHYTGSHAGALLLSHFWSLAVEEQFYLVWPFLVFFCPRHWLRPVLIGLVVAGIPIRYAVNFYFELPGYVAIAHVDAFAIGALSALHPWRLRTGWATALIVVLWTLGLVLLFINVPLSQGVYGWGYIVGVSVVNAASALLIEALVRRQFLPGLFENSVMRYCGKISYGIYIFHFPMQALVTRLLPGYPVLIQLAVQVGLTVAVSAASFALFESRFLVLKERWFPAAPPAPRPSPAPTNEEAQLAESS
jgi:peptidoglycan/LPS O-acetylase OafA/YrhL